MAEKTIKVKVDTTGATKNTQSLQKEFKNTATQASAMNSQIKNASGGLSNIRGVAQSAGYQLQDVAVQLQAGTNAFTVLGQQGSQFASAFGPTGAVVGAIIAVGAALAGVLSTSSDAAKKSIDDLIESANELGEAQKRLLQLRLSDEIAALAGPSSDAAIKIQVLNQELLKQQDILQRLESGTARGWLTDLVLSAEDTEEAIAELERELIDANASFEEIQEKTNRYREALEALKDGTIGTEESQKKLKKAFDDITETYQLQLELLGKSEVQQAKLVALSRLGADATEEQKKQVEGLIDAYYKEKDALDAKAEADKANQSEMEQQAEALKRRSDALDTWISKVEYYNLTEQELNNAWRDEELARLEEWYQLNLDKKDEYEAAFYEIGNKYLSNRRSIEEKTQKDKLTSEKETQKEMVAAAAAGQAALDSLANAAEGRSAKLNALVKGAAVFQASANLAVAYTQAFSDPTAVSVPQKFANYALLVSAGANLMSSLTNLQPPSRQTGGYMMGDTPYQVGGGAHTGDPEMYQSGGKSYLIDSQAGMMTRVSSGSGAQSGHGGGVAVSINNYGQESTASVTDGGIDENGVRQMIIEMTPSIMAKEVNNASSPYRNAMSVNSKTQWDYS
ncbi:tail length tape measure protein [Vibrio phage vB_VviC_ZQ26]|nr:tail length tape measure protein [Vibrio phage vB_VviC_ZQ26]